MTGISVNVPDVLKQYKSWVVWKLVHKPGKAKPDKIPFNALTIQAADTTNPNDWSDYASACGAFARGEADGIGFVFSSNDPFFFLDIDNAATLSGGVTGWSELSIQTVKYLTGAAVEISQSGRGLHVIGYCNKYALSDRRNVWRVNDAEKLEFYTSGRFMAVGQGNWTKLEFVDLTDRLLSFIPQKEGNEQDRAAAYRGPREGYTGTTDDDALIAAMLASGDKLRPEEQAAVIFGGVVGAAQSRVTIRQLWEGQSQPLSAAWPDVGPAGRAFDWSSADAALMAHLAFWTGCDGERMERLFARSALSRRDKWKDRSDYRVRTVLSAIAKCRNIYSAGSKKANGHASDVSGELPEAMRGNVDPSTPGGTSVILTPDEQIDFFAGCISISSMGKILTAKNQFLDSVKFNIEYGGKHFIIDVDGKTTDEPWKAATRGRVFRVPVVQDVCFRPDLPARNIIVDEMGRNVLNTYIPATIMRTEGDVSPFLHHMGLMFKDVRDLNIMLGYMAACVQRPGVKFQWCPVIQGIKGNGKTLVMKAVSYAVGERYTHIANADELGTAGTKFNYWLYGKLLIIVEEIYVKDKFHVLESMKPLITNTKVEFQQKGQDQFTGDNRANFIMATNHKDAIPVSPDERRYAVFYTAQQTMGDMVRDGISVGSYMPALWDWFNHGGGKEAIAGWLLRYQIPPQFDPGVELHRAPTTTSTEEAITRSITRPEEIVREAIEEGLPGFRGGYVSGWALEKLVGNKVPRRVYRDVLESLGYEICSSLPDGRLSSPVIQEDGRKPRIYIKTELQKFGISYDVNTNYRKAQGYL